MVRNLQKTIIVLVCIMLLWLHSEKVCCDVSMQWRRQNFAPGGGARTRGARVPKFVVTKSSISESHLALGLQNLRAFANSRGQVPQCPMSDDVTVSMGCVRLAVIIRCIVVDFLVCDKGDKRLLCNESSQTAEENRTRAVTERYHNDITPIHRTVT